MGGIKGGVGSFLLRRSAAKSTRQKHFTGPQYYKRKTFQFPKGYHRMHKRDAPAMQRSASPTQQIEHARYSHLPGDARTRPSEDFTFQTRVDKAMYAWDKKGSLQLHQIGGKKETFVCYRCGYPVRSALVAIKDDNWDWRMCYSCYTATIANGMERNTSMRGGSFRGRGGAGGGRGMRSQSRGRGGGGSRGGSRGTGGGRGHFRGAGRARGRDSHNRQGVSRGRGQQQGSRGSSRGRRNNNARQESGGYYRGDRQANMYPAPAQSPSTQPTAMPPFSTQEFNLDINTSSHEMKPEGINDKQDEVICHVAKFVVYSCDGAKYQQRLRQRTRHNPYFAFLDPRHAYHKYYAYLMDSYRYWKQREEGGGGFAEEGNDMVEAAIPMMGQGVSGYSAYNAYGEAEDGPLAYAGAVSSGYAMDEHAHDAHHVAATAAVSAEAAGPGLSTGSGTEGTTVADPHYGAGQEAPSGDDEDVDEDQFEMVMVNGVPTLVPKHA